MTYEEISYLLCNSPPQNWQPHRAEIVPWHRATNLWCHPPRHRAPRAKWNLIEDQEYGYHRIILESWLIIRYGLQSWCKHATHYANIKCMIKHVIIFQYISYSYVALCNILIIYTLIMSSHRQSLSPCSHLHSSTPFFPPQHRLPLLRATGSASPFPTLMSSEWPSTPRVQKSTSGILP